MKYNIKTEPILSVVNLYLESKLNLTPPYQRNSVWTLPAQKDLIDSVRKNYPLPTFFLRKVANNNYEMVDGQQRTRALLKYLNSNDLSNSIEETIDFKRDLLSSYLVSICIIEELDANERIEEFYFRVNSTGLHLNRPEKIKSKYLQTNLLQLSETILNMPSFQELGLFTEAARRRMLDRDFIEEIIVLIQFGITDKKKFVDRVYNEDITDDARHNIEAILINIIDILNVFNNIFQISKTRFRQRNDLYTLISFLKDNQEQPLELLSHFYHILLILEKEIRPSEGTCEILYDYALNCVSQSNSKDAREKRLQIIKNILIGDDNHSNEVQNQLIDYYGISEPLITLSGIKTFNLESLKTSVQEKMNQSSNGKTLF